MTSRMNSTRSICINKKLALFATMMALTQVAVAQIYRWTDSTGKVIVSDTPPPTNNQKVGKIAAPPQAAPETDADNSKAKVALDPEIEKKVRENERQGKEAEEKRKQQVAEYCDSAKNRLDQLLSGERITQRDKSGERSFMSDQQRAEEISKLRATMSEQKCS